MSLNRLLTLSFALLCVWVGCKRQSSLTINGAGATFPYPIYNEWFSRYAMVDHTVRINFQPAGSGTGKSQIAIETIDFGATDSPMTNEELAKAPGKILHLPTVAGAVVAIYNLPGEPALKLDGEALTRIFLRKITKWNDPALQALNPGVSLPDLEIAVVHRADGSGTTYIFTDYLSAVSPEWSKQVGKNTDVKWPTGQAAKGNDGVASNVKQTPGAIGYVELVYALQNKISMAALKNKAGKFVTATPQGVAAALEKVTVPDDFRFSMVDGEGAETYPISSVTWLLVYERQKSPTKGKKLVEFMKWMLRDGEKIALDLNYAPLPEALQQRVLQRIETIRY